MSDMRHLSTLARVSASFKYFFLGPILSAALLFTTPSVAVTFTPTQIASGLGLSNSIFSGDFNNDGILDLVTSDEGSNGGNYLSFYKGLGGGQYAPPVRTVIGHPLGQLVVADFNRDGKLDIAGILAPGPDAMVFLGNGDGTFTEVADLSGQNDSLAMSIVAADFNGDHIPDIALLLPEGPPGLPTAIEVFLGNGDGTFQQSANINTGVGGGGNVMVAGDFNADGHQDLGILAGGYVLMYLGGGNGQFQSPLMYTLPAQYAPSGLAVGDFYNDRIQTLAVLEVGSSNNTVSAYTQTLQLVNGQLMATAPQFNGNFYNAPSLYWTFKIAAGDLNGDFKDDLVVAGFYSNNPNINPSTPLTRYMLGAGNGTFGALKSLPRYGEYEYFPFVRDLNLDSRHDIGIDWSNPYPNGGGALVLLNTSAKINCAPPPANKLSVNICAPKAGATVGTTYTFIGAGNAFSGIAKRMELWIDGKKIGQNLEDQLRVTTTMTTGTHTASFIVVDSFDNHTTQAVTFTVQ
jgi:hypothetical protein